MYKSAKKQYEKYGVDVEKALSKLNSSLSFIKL